MKNLFIKLFLSYIRYFAKIQLKKINPVVIGIGGASGKTSTALLIGKVLGSKFDIKEGKGKNSETGIPLNILDIDVNNYTLKEWFKVLFLAPLKVITNNKKYDFLVLEMGIDSPKPPKNMEYLLSIVTPNIGVLTNIDIEHSLNFDSLINEEDEVKRREQILNLTAKEEGKLLKSIDANGTSIINLDDKNISNLLPLKSKLVTISAIDKNADFYISSVLVLENSFNVNFVFLKDRYALNIAKPLPKYFAYSLMEALAVAFVCKFNIKEGLKLIEENFSLPPGRFSIFEGIKDTTIIDSSYNSSLNATKGAIEIVKDIKKGRKVGILGDMRELGTLGRVQHGELAKVILKNLDYAILIGPLMGEYVKPFLEKNNFPFKHFESFKEVKEILINEIHKGDVVLVKGSQNTLYLERAVEKLLKNKKDEEFLPRRGNYWNKKRRG